VLQEEEEENIGEIVASRWWFYDDART